MKIGTLSFQVRGEHHEMPLKSAQRLDVVASVMQKCTPDLLLCAGCTLDSRSDLDRLQARLRRKKITYIIAIEVRNASVKASHHLTHELYLLRTNEKPLLLGRQCFATAKQAKDLDAAQCLERQIGNRKADVVLERKPQRLFVILCGEINILGGDINNVEPRSKAVDEALLKATIILNPTHDRMGNGGLLDARRKWLSQRNKRHDRVYVSASNWNTCKRVGNTDRWIRQSKSAETLHTVYKSGVRLRMVRRTQDVENYEYRDCEVVM